MLSMSSISKTKPDTNKKYIKLDNKSLNIDLKVKLNTIIQKRIQKRLHVALSLFQNIIKSPQNDKVIQNNSIKQMYFINFLGGEGDNYIRTSVKVNIL